MRMTRSAIAASAVALAAGTVVATSVASASPTSTGQPDRHGELLKSGIVARPADPTLAVTIRGVAPGAVPWVLNSGTARLDADGRLQVDLDGLLITGTGSALDGTTGPVKMVATSVSCDGAAPTVVTTGLVPLSSGGDARIDEPVTLPGLCLAPVLLVRANGATGPWIASSGF